MKRHVTKKAEHVEDHIDRWPINQLSQKRSQFVEEIISETLSLLYAEDEVDHIELLNNTIQLEQRRIKNQRWQVDPPNEAAFWNRIKKTVQEIDLLPDVSEAREPLLKEVEEKIVRAYAEEICGRFKPGMFRFARVFSNAFFSLLFNRFRTGYWWFWGNARWLNDKIRVIGPVDKIRELNSRGTLVMLPSHSSNLDSLFLGYTLDRMVGLTSPHYGAGLNLFNSELAAFFMHRLGAYRVDRRKKNKYYLDTLKSVSRVSIRWGVPNLFFPGGTRSRSGELEQELKLGLLGTTVEAQRKLFEQGAEERVFIVPIVVSYSRVLEDVDLARNYLVKQGIFGSIKKKLKKYHRFSKFWGIFRHLFSRKMVHYVSIGDPMDVLGNQLTDDGKSIDQNGQHISKRDYFSFQGEVNRSRQRESQYTVHLAKKVAQSYRRINVIRVGQVVCLALLEAISEDAGVRSLDDLVKLSEDDWTVSRELFDTHLSKWHEKFRALHKVGDGILEPEMHYDAEAEDLIGIAQDQLTTYGRHKVIIHKEGQIGTDHIGLIIYYTNRLTIYRD